ncbi:hypothetical protein ACI76O_11970 [Capnocytophaga cynodegmi]|uniref:hypothetical protein n=1 Tax=Capnocytophaga cynodegmi TaxID=28189 RepID=UPI00385D2184
MEVKYLRWGRGFGRVATETTTLNMLYGFNKTRYSCRKNQEGLLELASKEAHEQKKCISPPFIIVKLLIAF